MDQALAIGSVLVVDDNAENRALARATLDDEGIRAVVARSGDEAIAAFQRERPDCILLDIRMPGTDGIAVCEQIRTMEGGQDVAIVFLTAQRDVDTFDRAVRAGGDDFITKPFRPGELLVRVQTALRLRKIATERGELAAELKRQRDVLQRLQLQKEQLSAFLVHDLKNPVNTIELHAQRILRHTEADTRSRDAAAKIHEETRALLRMITNLLDIGKADEGQLAPVRRTVDAAALVAGAIEELRTRADAANIELVADVTVESLDVDSDLMHRVLANLIDNAIRHAPEGTAITVAATQASGAVELRVRDAGPGIPRDQRPFVFDRFVSGAATATRTNRGLGLAFCKLAVAAHGGEIGVEDAGPGATFLIRIPHD
ncbi:MAG TPA: response regulator [Kofleriaceae bacterium]|nr:response regulator [Kofleriaceae bacterium]